VHPAVSNPRTSEPGSALGRALLRRWPLVLLIALVAAGAAAAALAARSASYEAAAKLLVTPLPQYDETFFGTSLLRDAGDSKLTASTAAEVLHSRGVATEAARRLNDGTEPGSILDAVRVDPTGETNVLRVVARADRRERARRLATVFAQSAIAARWRTIAAQLDRRIATLTARRRHLRRGGAAAGDLGHQLELLRTTRLTGADPTLQVAQTAGPARAAARAPAAVVVIMSLIGGGFLGAMAAFGLDRLSRSVRDEDDALAICPLPVWARIPSPPRRLRGLAGIAPSLLTAAGRGAFRRLAAQVERWAPEGGSVAFISPSEADGRTTAAVNVAAALAERGRRTVIVRLGRPPGELDAAAREDLRDLGVAVFEEDDGQPRSLSQLLAEAHEHANLVLIDAPPLRRESDVLATAADLVLVVRAGHTSRERLRQLRDLLEHIGASPAGLLLVGVSGGRAAGGPAPAVSQSADGALTARDHVPSLRP
jgi:subunit length determinant Wzz-like protein